VPGNKTDLIVDIQDGIMSIRINRLKMNALTTDLVRRMQVLYISEKRDVFERSPKTSLFSDFMML
jgi:hypothetical protein